jgi:copper chaperone CopZ
MNSLHVRHAVMSFRFTASLSASITAIATITAVLGGCGASDATDTRDAQAFDTKAPAAGAAPTVIADARPVSGSGSVLWVRGMSCPKCVSNVDLQLKRLPGVDRVAINMGLGTVSVTYAGTERPSTRQLAEAVDNAALTLLRIEEVP